MNSSDNKSGLLTYCFIVQIFGIVEGVSNRVTADMIINRKGVVQHVRKIFLSKSEWEEAQKLGYYLG